MSLMPSLCAALQRAGGERLVMRAGERPHVLAGDRRQDVASAVLSVNAVEALAEQILTSAGQQQLTANGLVSESVRSPEFPHPLTARAERVGDDFCIELIVSKSAQEPEEPVVEPIGTADSEPATAVDQPPVVAEQATRQETMSVHDPAPEYVPEPDPPVVVAHATPPQADRPERVQPTRDEVTIVTRVQEPVRAATADKEGPRELIDWITAAADLGATTLYLRAGSPAAARVDDRIQPVGQDLIDGSVVEAATAAFTRGDGLWQKLPDGEWVRDDDQVGYISCRSFNDLHGPGLIVQLRPSTSLRLLHKHIPRQVRLACEGSGLVVVAAPSETDVEPLAAAVADWCARDRGGYLISLQRRSRSQDEISGAFVSRRMISGNEKDFAAAIRRAAQESPDILLVTGLQTEQPLQAAVLAAAGGRLVIVGVVAATTVDALRMLAGSDAHVRRAMAASLRAGIGYRSLRRIGGGRVLIQDVVLPGSAVCGLLEAGDFDGLARIQHEGAAGMRSVDESLARAVSRRQVTLREAAAQSVDRSRMVALVRTQARRSREHARKSYRERPATLMNAV